MTATILIVDDETPLLRSLSRELERAGHDCLTAATGREALDILEENSPSLAVLDIHLPDLSGLELLKRIRVDLPEVPVVIITAYASVDTAVEAMKEGAIDYLEKPLDLEELRLVVDRELKNARLKSEVEAYRRESQREHDQPIIGDSAALAPVRELIERIKNVPAENAADLPTVLIQGETGTGKGLLARHLHQSGPFGSRPFVTINCSGLPRELVESELFGHEKGAFTGATQRKQGLFEVAEGGTVFLDEIGDMPLDVQTKILGVLEHRKARRVGGTREYAVDVRIIAATHRNLERAAAANEFRSDLYFRLKVVTIAVPPLRDRREDVEALARHFLDRFRRKYARPQLAFDESALQELRDWNWPGNVRELAHTVEQQVILSDGTSLPSPGFGSVGPAVGATISLDFEHGDLSLDSVERRLIAAALEHTEGNVSEVARILGVSRGALRHRMEKLGLAG